MVLVQTKVHQYSQQHDFSPKYSKHNFSVLDQINGGLNQDIMVILQPVKCEELLSRATYKIIKVKSQLESLLIKATVAYFGAILIVHFSNFKFFLYKYKNPDKAGFLLKLFLFSFINK